ncbi:MAG: DUF3306 domain-containing protein [Betaproteobacteria bacterium]|nr:DUF3306 domain-containing protein [Betaproteobacteria bacterium]
MTTKDGSEKFVSRWSRLKQEAREQPAQKPAEERREEKGPAPELPPVEKLTFDSDYRKFFHPKVGEDLRRAALKKLFTDPHFNVMDGLDVYIDDYTKAEPIPAAMLASLRQAQKILDWAKEGEPERKPTERGESAPGEPPALAEQPRTDPAPGIEEPVRSAAVPSDRSEKT